MDTPTRHDDEPLWARVQDALDAGRDPWDDAGLAAALCERPALAAELERLEHCLTLLGEAAPVAPVAELPRGSRPGALAAGLAAAALVLLAARLVLVAGEQPRSALTAVDDLARAAVPRPIDAASGTPVPPAAAPDVRVLGWHVSVTEHRPGLEVRRERSAGRSTVVYRDARGSRVTSTRRSLR